MGASDGCRTGQRVVSVLAALFVAATIWLPHHVVKMASRPATFGFSIALACFLEVLIFAYFLLLFLPWFRRQAVWAIYPALGVVLGLYVTVCVVVLFTAGHAPAIYTALLVVNTLLFLAVTGALVILAAVRKPEERATENKQV